MVHFRGISFQEAIQKSKIVLNEVNSNFHNTENLIPFFSEEQIHC